MLVLQRVGAGAAPADPDGAPKLGWVLMRNYTRVLLSWVRFALDALPYWHWRNLTLRIDDRRTGSEIPDNRYGDQHDEKVDYCDA